MMVLVSFQGFTAIKQVGLCVGIEDPYFGVIGVCCRSPDCIECSERTSSFLNSFCHISVRASITLLIILPRRGGVT